MRILGNEYNRMELAGAFGDLGTFIPFVAAYITLNKMDPLGILVAFGVFKIFVGLYFKTPMPVQPMKAIGGMAIAHPESITHGMIWGSGIFTAVFWLIMGLTGSGFVAAQDYGQTDYPWNHAGSGSILCFARIGDDEGAASGGCDRPRHDVLFAFP